MRHKFKKISHKLNFILVCFVALIAVLLTLVFIYDYKQSQAQKDELIQRQKELRAEEEESIVHLSLTDHLVDWKSDNFIEYQDIIDGNASGEILMRPVDFLNNSISNSSITTHSSLVSISSSVHLNETDIAILTFAGHSESDLATLNVNIECGDLSFENTLYLTPDEQIFAIPITGVSSVNEINFSTVINADYSDLVISNMYLTNYKSTYTINQLATGVFQTNDICVTSLNNTDKVIPDGLHCLVGDDGVVFALSSDNSALIAYNRNDEGRYSELSRVESLGTVRDMAFTSDKNGIVITSRLCGMYIVDVSDTSNIQIASRRDTLELSSGINVSGSFAFIADRRMGIEIWDVSDIYNPVYISSIASKDSETSQYEYQDCEVDGNYLYVGVYEQREVEVYDITYISNPVFVSSLELDGRGQGIDVVNGILYASTALSSRDLETYSGSPELFESGSGNGLEIWDVSNPSEPKCLSIKKFEGRTSCNTSDIWDVEVVDSIAYVSNMFSGLWMIDVGDPINPIIINNYRIVLHDGDEDYRT